MHPGCVARIVFDPERLFQIQIEISADFSAQAFGTRGEKNAAVHRCGHHNDRFEMSHLRLTDGKVDNP